ncbi:hypothetical protein K488DRAFT_87852 [Vararia minispora EC-137]|uniref:Uncharacterized protein n=1 Tax=Vararia minispora EC-137 TaxID=1314806 RepID=A0ACB8QF97_9AGAM|nr:hypothetical protein K488DRAFT_87852 [Vararia minispora EC-137]
MADQIKPLVLFTQARLQQEKLEDEIHPRGTLRMGLDATSLFVSQGTGRHWLPNIAKRFQEVGVVSFTLRESLQTRVTEKLWLSAYSSLAAKGLPVFMGTVRYRYYPNLTFSMSTSLLHVLRPYFMTAATEYKDDDDMTSISAQTTVNFYRRSFPPLSVTLRRRLSPTSLTRGVFSATYGPKPTLLLELSTPSVFDLANDLHWRDQAASESGSRAVLVRRFGLMLQGLVPALRAGCDLVFPKFLTEVNLDLQFGLLFGPVGVLTGSWGDRVNGVTTSVSLNAAGVAFTMDMCYLGQRLSIPVTLTEYFDPAVAAFAAALPATASTLAYHFVVKPLNRKKRAQFFREARRKLEDEQSTVRREIANNMALLKDTARKHMQTEKAVGGLVILEALYGPTDSAPEARDLMIDVTVPLQALVYKSQLYIPGHRSKAGLPGFYDPAPACSKTLRVRYLFDDRMHYAEISDDRPCVLPLRGE